MEDRDRAAAATIAGVRPGATVVFVGHARLPQSLAPRDASPFVSLELEADVLTGTVVGLATQGVLGLCTRLLESVLLGKDINDGPGQPVEEIRRRYICPTQRAVCTAVANAYEAYHRYRQAAAS